MRVLIASTACFGENYVVGRSTAGLLQRKKEDSIGLRCFGKLAHVRWE